MEQQARQPQAQQQLKSQRRTDRELLDSSKSSPTEPIQLDHDMLKHVSGGAASGPHNNW
jgi:hypothetical protein